MTRSAVRGRHLRERVKTAKKRSLSSTLWLERQLNDPYVKAAKAAGYRSRAAYKLDELDRRFRLFRHGARVLDLGAAPGGWTQVAAERVGAANGRGAVYGLDLQEIAPIPGATLFTLDIHAPDALARIAAAVGGPVDVVLSDMAASATGHAATDHMRIMALAELAFEVATHVLKPGGAFVAKVLKGGTERDLLNRLKRHFATVKHAKPPASRAESAETYVIALGYRR
jgi:23S rRNA (uridine2552-2'-O)-methyltransferase